MKVFKNELTTLIYGDAIEALDEYVDDNSVHLIFVDPPYNIGKTFSNFKDKWQSEEAYARWCHQWIDICIRKLTGNGSMYLMASTQAMPYLDLYVRNKMTILSRIVWAYDSSGVQAKKYFGSLWEPILFGVKNKNNYIFNTLEILIEAKTGAKRKLINYRVNEPKPYNTKKVPGNVWNFYRVRYRMDEYEEHPSQKPEALLERIIKASSNKDSLILDPFAGTFTTCAVAQKLGRKSIGIEFQEDYIKIGLRRLKILSEYNGEKLRAIDKTFIRKNDQSKNTNQPELF